ncbi:DUF952 domain-containing protein [Hyphomicrobium sp.]|uniref:DUF952 domain-containing protein n=1 Tax=Hyphomicrobium sp. TaxID=82 RepID=UPI002C489AB5|nr:DUF952 domain-containing protein [Hyphomicrobium sp.]HVZ05675.1 DUF952 domain-containing protein [Hyphomicrobium sp.]
MIFKIAKVTDWRDAVAKGHYSGSLDDVRDGFIHLSSKSQLRGTLEKHFRGAPDLVLIAFQEGQLGPELRWETSRGGDLFPHLYGNLPTTKAIWERALTLDADGIPFIEDEWLEC